MSFCRAKRDSEGTTLRTDIEFPYIWLGNSCEGAVAHCMFVFESVIKECETICIFTAFYSIMYGYKYCIYFHS